MESWLIFAVISALFAGTYSFMMKVISQRNYNVSLFSIISYSMAALISVIFYLYNSYENFIFDNLGLIILIGFGNTFFYFISTISRVRSLDNIDTTIFFPLYKTFGPIIVTAISIFVFKENLEIKDIFGIILGILIPLMLLTRTENKVQKNLKLGFIFVLITSIFSSLSNGIGKALYSFNLDLNLFVVISLIIGAFLSLVSYKLFDKKTKKKYEKKGIYKLGILGGFTHFFSFYFMMRAVEGNLAIAYTINSFSILIPIILSVIFYKEEMTFKKAFVIFLSIISMLLFI